MNLTKRFYELRQVVHNEVHSCATLELGDSWPRVRYYGQSMFSVVGNEELFPYIDYIHGNKKVSTDQRAAEVLRKWHKLVRAPLSDFEIEKWHIATEPYGEYTEYVTDFEMGKKW